MNSEVYTLYGLVNVFDVTPAFLDAIYTKDGEFYFAKADITNDRISRTITSFEKIEDNEAGRDMISRCRPNNNLSVFLKEAEIGSNYTYFYELNNGVVITGNIDEMQEFLSMFLEGSPYALSKVARENIKEFLKMQPQDEIEPNTKTL